MDRPSSRRRARIAPLTLQLIASLACLLGTGVRVRAESPYESTVTGRASGAALEDRAASTSVITDERTPRAGESLPQLLAELPGVTVNRLGGLGALATLSLRGSTWNQVAVYVDGLPLNNGLGAGVDLSTLPLGDIERIEVYRGMSPLAFGGSALGGVVSITTRNPRVDGISAQLLAGSFDSFGAGATGSVVRRRVRVYLGAHYLGARNDFAFTSDNGTVFDPSARREARRTNNAVSQADGVVRVVVPIDGGRELSLGGLLFLRAQGLPGYGTVRQTTRASLELLRVAGSVVYDSRRDLGPGGRLRVQLYYHFERQRYDDPLGEIALVPVAVNNQLRTVGGNLRLVKSVGAWLTLSAILDGRYELFEPYDAAAQTRRAAPGTRLFGGVGVEADAVIRRARLHLVPSVRVEVARDERSLRNALREALPETPAQTNLIPAARLALHSQVTGWLALRANGARYARLPSMTELYGNSGFLQGNPELVPETGWNTDAGLHLRGGRGRFFVEADAGFFGSFVEQLINYEQDAHGRARALNLGRARILGTELSIDARLTRYARLFASATVLDARDTSDTSLGQRQPHLPNRPRFSVHARPEGRLPVGRVLELGAYCDLDITDGNYLDPANLVRLPTRVLVGVGVFAEIARARNQPRLVLIASAQNLGDARVFDFSGFPLPSRAFFVSARLSASSDPPISKHERIPPP